MHNGLNWEYSLEADLYHSYFSFQLRKRDIIFSFIKALWKQLNDSNNYINKTLWNQPFSHFSNFKRKVLRNGVKIYQKIVKGSREVRPGRQDPNQSKRILSINFVWIKPDNITLVHGQLQNLPDVSGL